MKCDCQIDVEYTENPYALFFKLEMCTMHEMAEEMLNMLSTIFYNEDMRDTYFATPIFNDLFELISKARGEE